MWGIPPVARASIATFGMVGILIAGLAVFAEAQPYPHPVGLDVGITAGGAIGETVELSLYVPGPSPAAVLAASIGRSFNASPFGLAPPFALLVNRAASQPRLSVRVPVPPVAALVGTRVYLQGAILSGGRPRFTPVETWHVAPNIGRRFRRIRATDPRLHAMPTDRADVVLADGSLLFTGGRRPIDVVPNPPLTSMYRYQPLTDTYTQLPPMNAARAGHVAVRLSSGRVLLAGDGTADLFDPAVGRSTSLGALPRPIGSPMAARFFDLANRREYVLLAGGVLAGRATGNAVLFDVANATFTALPGMNVPRSDAAMVAAPGGVMISGGQDLGALADVEYFSLATRSFHRWGAIRQARRDHAMVALDATTFAVIGGVIGFGSTSDIEVFDGLRRTSTRLPWTLALPRSNLTTMPLADGSLFVAHNNYREGLTAEILTPAGSTLLRPLDDRYNEFFGNGFSALYFPAPGGGVIAIGWGGVHYMP